MTDRERELLDDEELALVRELESEGLIFMVGLTAVVTPKGRGLLAKEEAAAKKVEKKPMGFLDPQD